MLVLPSMQLIDWLADAMLFELLRLLPGQFIQDAACPIIGASIRLLERIANSNENKHSDATKRQVAIWDEE